jgi:hypothetical protein
MLSKKTAYPENIIDREKYPEQYAMFKEITETLYRVHAEKMQDYSPHNMLGTGEFGAIVRIWDKTARLMNLYGFDISTGTFSGKKSPKNESIEDNLTDLANYAIIALILMKGKWGK